MGPLLREPLALSKRRLVPSVGSSRGAWSPAKKAHVIQPKATDASE